MAIFEKGELKVISAQQDVDLSSASINKNLSAVDYDSDGKFFFMTIDKALFSDPVSTIKTVLDAHGFVPNLENILSCLDSFNFSVHSKVSTKAKAKSGPAKVTEYLPCIRFELPKKNRVGEILQSFYDEIEKYETKASDSNQPGWVPDPVAKKTKDLMAEVKRLEAENKELNEQLSAVTYQLSLEQKSLSRASKALDSQQLLPDNARICRVDQVDLKKRLVKLKCNRKTIDIPTHMLDHVPDYQARCLITFDESEDIPLGIIFLNHQELADLEKRTAELLFVKGDTFKARDSKRNIFQIKAVNEIETETIKSLSRGMKVVISISDGYVVRFSVIGASNDKHFETYVQEQFIIHDIARNPLVVTTANDD